MPTAPQGTRSTVAFGPIDNAASFGDAVRNARIAARIDKSKLAFMLGYAGPCSIEHIEEGRQRPPIERIPEIARVLDTSEDYLYFAAGVIPPRIRAITDAYWPAMLGLMRLEQALRHDGILQRIEPALTDQQRYQVLSGSHAADLVEPILLPPAYHDDTIGLEYAS